MSLPNPRDYGLPEDAILVNIDGVVRDLRTVPTEQGGDMNDVTPQEEQDQLPPDPGTGEVWVTHTGDAWTATWSHDDGSPTVRILIAERSSCEEAVEWAQEQPATKVWLWNDGAQEFLQA